jgi:hypothetical protein
MCQIKGGRQMRIFFGVIGIIAGIVLSLYLGLYVCFVGGAIDIINEIVDLIKGGEVSAFSIVIGIVKMAVAGLVGYLSAFVFIVPSIIALGLKKS